jgi:membrane protease YdiL (CAAX protease family)
MLRLQGRLLSPAPLSGATPQPQKHSSTMNRALQSPAIRSGTASVSSSRCLIAAFLAIFLLPWRNALGPGFVAPGSALTQLQLALVATGPFIGLFWLCSIDDQRDKSLPAMKALFEQPRPLMHIFCFAAAASVGEEMLFRGLIQSFVMTVTDDNQVLALCFSSILFGGMHVHSLRCAVLAALAGLMLGTLYIAGDSVLAPIIVHTIYDMAAIWFLRFQCSRQDISANATRLTISALVACELGYFCADDPLQLNESSFIQAFD